MATYEIVNDEWAKKICECYRNMNPGKKDFNDNQILNRLIEIAFNQMCKDYACAIADVRVAKCEHKNVQNISTDFESCKDCGGHRLFQKYNEDDCGFNSGYWTSWRI